MDDPELAQLQAALLDALRQASSPEAALSLLARAPLSAWAQQWLAQSDPRSVEIAMVLVRRWAKAE